MRHKIYELVVYNSVAAHQQLPISLRMCEFAVSSKLLRETAIFVMDAPKNCIDPVWAMNANYLRRFFTSKGKPDRSALWPMNLISEYIDPYTLIKFIDHNADRSGLPLLVKKRL